jgi:predicted Rdx family selenoprotein
MKTPWFCVEATWHLQTHIGGKAVELKTTQLHPDVTCQDIIECVTSKDHMWKRKVDGQSNHLEALVRVLFIRVIPNEHRQRTDSKAHHLNSEAERDKS